jgi:hypothetical protein
MPGGGAVYCGTEESRTLTAKLNARGVALYVRVLDMAVSEAGLALVVKSDVEELKKLRSKVKQLESLLGVE